ncbi:MAG: AMP-binding protein, partial [bacterium]|nr:AMP-binding protein [bacterium]
LRRLGLDAGASLYMTLLAAFMTLLHRITGQQDIVVGSPVANRERRETEGLIGLFANTLVMRGDLSGDPSFAELLGRARELTLEAYAFQDVPFEKLVEELQPERSLSRNPLFQVALGLQNAPLPEVRLPGLTLRPLEFDFNRVRVDLELHLWETAGGGLEGAFFYSTELFDAATIARMAEGLKRLLAAIAADPQKPLAELPSMSEPPRAEASEVEGALVSLPEVADAAVLCRPTEDGTPQRVAYVVPAADFRPERLADRLPPVMQPDAWVPIAALPLRPDGEVDAGALRRTEVIDRELVARVERGFAELPGVGEVAAVVREIAPPRSFLHLSDLLPDWRSAAVVPAPVSIAVSAPSSAAGETPPAVTSGPPLAADPGASRVLAEVLERAAGLPDSGIFTLDDQGEEHWQSYAELLAEAERMAGGLDREGLRPGDRVILQLGRNRDFVAAFWASIVGGYLPVPLTVAPDYHPENTSVRKLHNAWQLLEQPFVLTDGRLREAIRALAGPLHMPGLRVESIEELRGGAPNRRRRRRRPDEVAVILLSSGSTGMPKGIEQSHRRLLDWAFGTIRHNRFRRDDVMLSWTPLEHVGGLLFAHLRSVVTGARQVLVPTATILGDPLKWLDLIERYRVRTTWASNFAFALVNERLAESPERRWDLSSVRLITNAGEMIVPRTARRFLKLLAPHSLALAALQPAWGLSETCCGVTYSHRFSLAATADDDRFVEVGSLIPGHQLRIVLESGAIASEGVIGDIEVRGPSVTDRYLGNP